MQCFFAVGRENYPGTGGGNLNICVYTNHQDFIKHTAGGIGSDFGDYFSGNLYGFDS
jgi:hypothetical protein